MTPKPRQTTDYFVTASELKLTCSHLQKEGTYYIAGSNSIYVPKGRRRYTDKAACKPWPDLGGQIRLQTPGGAARTELMREWPTLNRVGWSGDHIKLLGQRSPMYYSGQRVGHFTYIDLVSAYGQIYKKLWLDTSYPRGLYGQYPLRNVEERLEVWKAARNSLIGVCRSTGAVAYRGTKRIDLKTSNSFLSPGLWATTQSILHMIAQKAIEFGAIYINVDGYIFPTGIMYDSLDLFTDWLSENNFKWSARGSGQGEIVSWNNYQIGSKLRTKSNRLGLISKSMEFTNVKSGRDRENWASYWGRCNRIYRAST